jgi:hypothetical protein
LVNDFCGILEKNCRSRERPENFGHGRNRASVRDCAVMAAYGFDIKISEAECVAKLFQMYQKLTAKFLE